MWNFGSSGRAGDEAPEKLGLAGNLVLHSQFIMLAVLVLGAVVIKVFAPQ